MASVAGVAATHRRRRLGDVVPVSMASAAGVAGRVIPGVAMLNNIVSMASAADVAATSSQALKPKLKSSQWPLRPVSLRHTMSALGVVPA